MPAANPNIHTLNGPAGGDVPRQKLPQKQAKPGGFVPKSSTAAVEGANAKAIRELYSQEDALRDSVPAQPQARPTHRVNHPKPFMANGSTATAAPTVKPTPRPKPLLKGTTVRGTGMFMKIMSQLCGRVFISPEGEVQNVLMCLCVYELICSYESNDLFLTGKCGVSLQSAAPGRVTVSSEKGFGRVGSKQGKKGRAAALEAAEKRLATSSAHP